MRRESELTAREVEILHAIVRAYIETGEPVASRSLAKRRAETLSPATIRNVMADLSESGFLAQPHTSAGRIPTEKAFRHYAQFLSVRRMSPAEVERLRASLEVDNLEERVERSSHALTELTHHIGIAAAIPPSSQTLDRIELITLAEERVLMIVVTRDGMVRNRVVSLDAPIGQEELNSIRNYLNGNFSGWVLADARRELEERLEQESAAYDAVLRRLIVLYTKGLLDLEVTPEIHMEGFSNLIGLELNLTQEKTRELFRALEEKKKILFLLDRFLEQSGEVGIQVGLGEAHPAMRELSLIGITLAMPNGLEAKIAVLGPLRMNYERVVSAVLNVSRIFRTLPS